MIDLGCGDAGKGSIVDFIVRRHNAHTVVRFNGGPQAGHNVVTPDGRHHTFSQFGSGTFVPGVRTLLSRFMLIEPYALFNEATHLQSIGVSDALDRLLIDRRCLVITPAHQAANRLREIARFDAAHGTCGLGVGEAMGDALEHSDLALRADDLAKGSVVARKLQATRDLKLEQLRDVIKSLATHPRAAHAIDTLRDDSWMGAAVENYAHLAERAAIIDDRAIAAVVRAPGTTAFEGAQGVLLDEWHGFHPHTTWSTTTFANADTLLAESGTIPRVTRIGVLRSYATRHGQGPLVTEDPAMREHLPEPHNSDTGWQGPFRVGSLDAVAVRYALDAAGGIDLLALTHMDHLPHLPARLCVEYRIDVRSPAYEPDLALIDGNRVIDLRRSAHHDVERQARLTRLLKNCRPIYADIPAMNAEAFVKALERVLPRVGIISHGPTADDKRILCNI